MVAEELLARIRGSCVDGEGRNATYLLDGNFKDMSGSSGPLAAQQPGPALALSSDSRSIQPLPNHAIVYLRPRSNSGWARFSQPQKFCSIEPPEASFRESEVSACFGPKLLCHGLEDV